MADKEKKTERIEVVDALRGIALFAIIILHSCEHYNLYYKSQDSLSWLAAIDKGITDMTWFMLAGKAFSIFSFLFGLSFFIQLDNAAKRGIPFRGRFVWRMFLLVAFSQLHSLFYNGDILLLYAILGIFLVSMSRCSTRTVLITASIFILQPVEWIRVICAILQLNFPEYGNHWFTFFELTQPVLVSGSFSEVLCSNITHGQLYGNLWQIENGRIFQIGGLFLFGMVAGRIALFKNTRESIAIWKRITLWAALLFIPFYTIRMIYPSIAAGNNSLLMPLNIAIPSICNFLFAAMLTGFFVLLWYDKGNGYYIQRLFIPFGKMSLTNYIVQSIIGVCIFYGFGGGLYKCGATACWLIGILVFAILLLFSNLWLSKHKHGPLEWIWKKLTWIK